MGSGKGGWGGMKLGRDESGRMGRDESGRMGRDESGEG